MRYCGAEIFKMVDTYGFPLDIINMMLREKGAFFPAEEFIGAAKKAKWTNERIYQTMLSASPIQEQIKDRLRILVETTNSL